VIGNIDFQEFQMGIQGFSSFSNPSMFERVSILKHIYFAVLTIPHNTYKWAEPLKMHG